MKKTVSGILLAGILLTGFSNSGTTASSYEALSATERNSAVSTAASEANKIQSIKIAGSNLSKYMIYQPAESSECLNFAAAELSSYIEKASGDVYKRQVFIYSEVMMKSAVALLFAIGMS